MTIYTTDTNRTYELTLRYWSDRDHQYKPDCFDDLECNFPDEHEWNDDHSAILCTQSELDELIEWWSYEVDHANNDPDYIGDVLKGRDWQDYPDPEDDFWSFDAAEIA